jgi:DeoR family deoxyribose operon repressor
MPKPDRLRALADALTRQNVMRLRDAAALLGVSEMTVRRDIAANSDRFTYLGGYIVSATDVPNNAGYSLEQEKDHFAQAKPRGLSATTKRFLSTAARRSPRSRGSFRPSGMSRWCAIR